MLTQPHLQDIVLLLCKRCSSQVLQNCSITKGLTEESNRDLLYSVISMAGSALLSALMSTGDVARSLSSLRGLGSLGGILQPKGIVELAAKNEIEMVRLILGRTPQEGQQFEPQNLVVVSLFNLKFPIVIALEPQISYCHQPIEPRTCLFVLF